MLQSDMDTAFDTALSITISNEGGFANHPLDRGGRTNFGITQAVYDQYRLNKMAHIKDVSAIDFIEVRNIYEVEYWNKIRGDHFPLPLSVALFDMAVNCGVYGASIALQRILRGTTPGIKIDGKIGPQTLRAASVHYFDQTPQVMAYELNCRRIRLYRLIIKRDPTQMVFLWGWVNRVHHLTFRIASGFNR